MIFSLILTFSFVSFFAVQIAPASREQGRAQACVKNYHQTNKQKQHSAAIGA
jgi:hypothetical protein